jgi:hypothetical protein
MTFQESVISGIEDIFHNNTLISISGKAGTGKTSLSLFLVGKFLTSIKPYEGSCIWVQASEQFSRKRLKSMFKTDPEKLSYLSSNIFVFPRHNPFTSYGLQVEGLKKLSGKNYLFPPNAKYMVIDNISHHLRYKLSRIADLSMRSDLINKFYDTVIIPLLFQCHREGITLIILHEVSFDVNSQQTRPFFSKLYERIRGVNIYLSKSLFSEERTLELEFKDKKYSFLFNLDEGGFWFST